MLRPLVALYRRFLDVPESGGTSSRAPAGRPARPISKLLPARPVRRNGRILPVALPRSGTLGSQPPRPPPAEHRRCRHRRGRGGYRVRCWGSRSCPPKGHRATISGSARPRSRTPPCESLHEALTLRTGDHPGKAAAGARPGSPSPESTSRGRSTDCPDRLGPGGPRTPRPAARRSRLRSNGARAELITRDSLRFAWMPAQGVTEYRVCLITARRDARDRPGHLGPLRDGAGEEAFPTCRPGSFIFRVDGLAGGRLCRGL